MNGKSQFKKIFERKRNNYPFEDNNSRQRKPCVPIMELSKPWHVENRVKISVELNYVRHGRRVETGMEEHKRERKR